jgi:hypothetical protein
MKTFNISDFSIKGNEFTTKKQKIGYVRNKKLKAPKKVKIEGVGVFTLKTYWNHQVTGMRYFYESTIDAHKTNGNGLSIIFW